MPEEFQPFLDPALWRDVGWTLALLVGAIVVGLVGHRVLFAGLLRWSKSTVSLLDDAVVKHLRRPLSVTVPLALMTLVWPFSPLADAWLSAIRQLHTIALTASLVWVCVKAVRVLEESLLCNYDLTAQNNIEARVVHTQVRVFRNLAIFLTVVVGGGIALMTFPQVQKIGVSLLASAGVAGVVIGFAAQRSIATLIAGIQIALTQPVRIDDVVIVENEWGRIEEITLTYVVVRIWDKRRLVLPITYFIEKPFQNWTRVSADIIGTVVIHTDYTVPVCDMREAYKKILDESGMWDGEAWGLQVTDANERTMQVRALLSAPDSGVQWNLRCHVREKLIGWLQQHHPEALPMTRVDAHVEQPVPAPSSPKVAA